MKSKYPPQTEIIMPRSLGLHARQGSSKKVTRRESIRRMALAPPIAASMATALLSSMNVGCNRRRATEYRAPLELIVTGGRVVSDTQDLETDIRIVNGVIRELGVGLVASQKSSQVIDATGRIVVPGGIDPHVHLDKPWVDDFTSGSQAALAGGITTVGHMCSAGRSESPLDAIHRERARIKEQAIADVFLHAVIDNPAECEVNELEQLLDAGVASIKIFMLTQKFDAAFDRAKEFVRYAGRIGFLTLLHAEDKGVLDLALERLTAQNHVGIAHFPESRPVESEVVAVRKAIKLCQETGAPIYIVHLSSAEALNICQSARNSGLPVFVETRPMYLHLTDEVYQRDDRNTFVCMPPIRGEADQNALWKGVRRGSIQTIASDHAPWKKRSKLDSSMTIQTPKGGVNNLQVMLPMLMDQGVRKERISLKQFVELTSTNSAKLFGLYPQKGCLAVGSDGDLAIWDSERTKIINGRDGFSKAGFSIYDGQSVTGWPTTTIRRGVVVYERNRMNAVAGSGIVLKQKKRARMAAEID